MVSNMNIQMSDECYTPTPVYETVKNWACAEYNIDPKCIVRPFYVGGDYEHFPYRPDSVVIDNPPFSLLSKICAFYLERNIRFFMFAPTLTLFGQRSNTMKMTHIVCGNNITYDNGVKVPTSYITDCDDDTILVRTAPDLTELVEQALELVYGPRKTQATKFEYPDNLVSPAMLRKYSNYGIDITIRRNECVPVPKLDAQAGLKKEVFGGGLLVSDRVAVARAEAERRVEEATQPIRLTLSDREKELVSELSGQ